MLVAAMLCFAAVSYAQDIIDVTIVEQIPVDDLNPRSPSVVPITACVIYNTIYLSFDSNLGCVDVVLEEAFEGIILQTSVDTSTLSAIIPFNAAPGEYLITFTLPSGSVYQGTFDI